jgi:hypothetical protein
MSLQKFIGYAQETLQLEQLQISSEQLELDIKVLLNEEAGYTSEIRRLEYQASTRRGELLVENARESGSNSWSVAQAEREYKLATAADEKLKEIEECLLVARGNLDGVQARINGGKTNHKGFVARMGLVAAYIQGQSVAKEAELVAQVHPNVQPW